MSVYVDDSNIPWRGKRWCHLTADSTEELHEFAERIGLPRSWFQPGTRPELDHYDVTGAPLRRALEEGAVQETWREGARRTIARRAAGGDG